MVRKSNSMNKILDKKKKEAAKRLTNAKSQAASAKKVAQANQLRHEQNLRHIQALQAAGHGAHATALAHQVGMTPVPAPCSCTSKTKLCQIGCDIENALY